jgi:hypothetical protein
MRYLILGFCVLSAACTDTRFNAPTGPSSIVSGAGSMNATRGSELPFSGDLQATETAAGPLHHLTGSGEATHLGRFTLSAEFTVVPAPPVSTASGTATWTSANGDEIFTTLTGEAVITFPHAAIVETYTITGGTGRFADASGTLVMERSLDLLTFASTASITGTISLGH